MSDTFEHHEIGQRLVRIRRAFSDLNQKDWALKNRFNLAQYNNWERGFRRIPVEAAIELCARYGVTLDFVYRGRSDGLPENLRKSL
jgi:transcriptional regulator with XRE-family HTH domain